MLPLADYLNFHPPGSTYSAIIDTHIWPMYFKPTNKKRLNTIQIIVLRRQYQPVAQDGKEEDSSTWTTDRGECEVSRSNAMAGSLD